MLRAGSCREVEELGVGGDGGRPTEGLSFEVVERIVFSRGLRNIGNLCPQSVWTFVSRLKVDAI